MPIYVQHEVIARVPDVFDAEAIWRAPGLALFARRPLLRDLLERSPREQRGRAATRCFSHVTLMLPQEEVDDDYHLTRGARARELTQALTALHQKDFGDLLGADQVRYEVAGAPALREGQVEVRFGHAVYLPAAGEKVLYNVSVSADGAAWRPVCPIYPQQRLALVGGDSGTPAGWPFGADGAALIVNDGPDTAPVLQMRPKDGFDCRFDAAAGCYAIQSKRAGGARLLLKISRAGAPPAVPAPAAAPLKAAVWQPRRTAPAAPEPTAAPRGERPRAAAAGEEATFAPLAQRRVSLAALALPRLSRYRDTGASLLALPFDRALALSTRPDAALSITVDGADRLGLRSATGSEPVSAPASFTPFDARALRLLAVDPAMAERYCALLILAQPPALPLAGGARLVFGRGAPALAALRLLDAAPFLQRGDGAGPASAERLGLSRKAFSFEATAAGFSIGRLTPTQALYHLDEQMNLVAAVTGEAPYLLPPGHHLVAGPYVLRFEA